jgi:hypothetical protein
MPFAHRRVHNLHLSEDRTVQVVICGPVGGKGANKNQVMVEDLTSTRLMAVEATALQPTDKFEK